MALHTPAHHAGIAGDHLLRDLLVAVGLATRSSSSSAWR